MHACAGKEYAKADSRYVSSDPFTVTMESTTAFVEGPMCLAVAYAIATQASWRFPLQIIVSVGQLYGCILYFAIVWFGDVRVCVCSAVLLRMLVRAAQWRWRWRAVLTTTMRVAQTEYGPHGDPIYYWFYFIFMNAIWILIPFLCIVQAYRRSSAALGAAARAAQKKRQA